MIPIQVVLWRLTALIVLYCAGYIVRRGWRTMNRMDFGSRAYGALSFMLGGLFWLAAVFLLLFNNPRA